MKLKKYLIILLMLISPVMAFDLDASIDDEIRKNYNPSALEDSLPALPKISPSKNSGTQETVNKVPKSLPQIDTGEKTQYNRTLPVVSNIDKSTAIRIKSGTKFRVKSSAYISDRTAKGARLTLTTLYPVSQRYITIPAGTAFKAVVVNSHAPQITGNGGLIVVKIDGVDFKGYRYSADGKITKANNKKIFVNNIKGQRKYWKNVAGQVQKGQNFYTKTRRVSSKLSNNPFGLIIAPIPTVLGMGVYAVNFVGSPVFSIVSKGGSISIPAGREFEIKLLEDVYLQNQI